MNKYIEPTIYPIHIYVCIKDKNTKSFFKQYNINLDFLILEKDVLGRTYFDNDKIVVVLNNNNLPALVHEIFHVVEYVFAYVGIIHSLESSEAWAYYIQYLTRKILE